MKGCWETKKDWRNWKWPRSRRWRCTYRDRLRRRRHCRSGSIRWTANCLLRIWGIWAPCWLIWFHSVSWSVFGSPRNSRNPFYGSLLSKMRFWIVSYRNSPLPEEGSYRRVRRFREFRGSIRVQNNWTIGKSKLADKELLQCKERQKIEIDAQAKTLEEQRNHIAMLEKALNNAQERLAKRERVRRWLQLYHLKNNDLDLWRVVCVCG